jgi:hypothetical protein
MNPPASTPTKTTLCCLVQYRLGAMDRLLGALTARGMVPERFVSAVDAAAQTMQVVFTIACPCEKSLEKLIKVLYKQVYVLDIQLLMAEAVVNDLPGQAGQAAAPVTAVEKPTPVSGKITSIPTASSSLSTRRTAVVR